MIKSSAPTRIDLAGGTLDIWPLNLFFGNAPTVNAAINLYATVEITPRKDKRIVLRSQDLQLENSFSSINTLPENLLEINTLEVPVLISDEYFGEVEVFHKKITKSFTLNPLVRKITVKYQGCNEKGFCYPLITKQLFLKHGEIFINKGT